MFYNGALGLSVERLRGNLLGEELPCRFEAGLLRMSEVFFFLTTV